MLSRKPSTLTIRLDPALRKRMDAARKAAPYPPTITSIVERGIVLACDEIESISRVAAPSAAKARKP